jgi:hypothetical protein
VKQVAVRNGRLQGICTSGPNGYFADFFGGSLGISRAAHRKGYRTRHYDLRYGDKGDLSKPSVYLLLIRDIRLGRVIGACLAPPCGTFSIAHDRSNQVRSNGQPWGLPSLSDVLQAKVNQANILMKAAMKIVEFY